MRVGCTCLDESGAVEALQEIRVMTVEVDGNVFLTRTPACLRWHNRLLPPWDSVHRPRYSSYQVRRLSLYRKGCCSGKHL